MLQACSQEVEPGLMIGFALLSPAAQADTLDRQSLALVNAYNPGLSGAWMLQRAMSVRPGEKPNPNFINQARTLCSTRSPPQGVDLWSSRSTPGSA